MQLLSIIFVAFLFNSIKCDPWARFITPKSGNYVTVTQECGLQPWAAIDFPIGTSTHGFILPEGHNGPCNYVISGGRLKDSVIISVSFYERMNIIPVIDGRMSYLNQTPQFNDSDLIMNTKHLSDATSNTLDEPVVLVFEQPPVNSTTVIPSDFLLQLVTPVDYSISTVILVQLQCGNIIGTGLFSTNILYGTSYPSVFYGLCTLKVVEAPSNFVIPEDRQFYLKYSLSFVNPPTFLFQSTFFLIQIDSSAIPPIGLGTTTLNLICTVDDSSVTIQSWSAVPLNQQNVLELGSVPSSATNCVLATTGDDTTFIQVSTPISIENSPFGGDLQYISPEQAEEFARTVSAINGIVQLTNGN